MVDSAWSRWSSSWPLVIAHRGACKVAPENTLAAFEQAVSLGADAIELDAKLSADGEVVVMHDQTVNRTTDGAGAVGSMSLRELKALDAGVVFGACFAGEGVPTLREVFERVGGVLLVNVELTNYARPWDRLPEKVIEVVRECGMAKRVLFSSFNPFALARARRLAPDIPLGLLLTAREGLWARSLLRGLAPFDALHLEVPLVTSGALKGARSAGKKVIVWTVNDRGELGKVVRMGVDGVITDVPDVARAVLTSGILHGG